MIAAVHLLDCVVVLGLIAVVTGMHLLNSPNRLREHRGIIVMPTVERTPELEQVIWEALGDGGWSPGLAGDDLVRAVRAEFMKHTSGSWLDRDPLWLVNDVDWLERELDLALGLAEPATPVAPEPLCQLVAGEAMIAFGCPGCHLCRSFETDYDGMGTRREFRLQDGPDETYLHDDFGWTTHKGLG